MEHILNPWPWYVSGPLIALVMALLLYFGKTFGMSSNLRTMCSIAGAGKFSDFFKFKWKDQLWNLTVVFGAVIGGYIAVNYLSNDSGTELNPTTVTLLVLGGLLVGFGTRYAGGCTSGHAITGLSSLQKPSLIAVVGFFIGGLIMTNFILPLIF